MDDILPRLLAFPPHPSPALPLSDQQFDEGIRALVEVVKGISDSKLLQKTASGEHLLDFVNPSLNTASYTFILVANLNKAKQYEKAVDMDALWNNICTFLSGFDPRQIRYLGHELAQIIDTFANIAQRHHRIPLALPRIRDALIRYDPTGTVFTPKHLLLVKLAVEARSYDDVVPVLEKTILYIPGASEQPNPEFICNMTLSPLASITAHSSFVPKHTKSQDILEYFLLSGMAYIGLNNWRRAKECLERAITYPAKENGCSKIMTEAYKKWVLVSLLLDGKSPTLPMVTSGGTAKLYHTLAKPYEIVSQIFEAGTASRLKSEIETGQTIWQQDMNVGLMMAVLAAYQQFQIRNLGKVHSKLSIMDIHNATQSAEVGGKLGQAQFVRTLVQNMIANGSLDASLSYPPDKSPVVTFSENGPAMSEKMTQVALAESTHRIKALALQINNIDRTMTYEKEYLKHVQKVRKNKKNTDQGVVSVDMDWPGEDEDLMASMY
ncbi:hypothetical protein BJ875DRAFT_502271 [Amylocarpus encephaloides]|uniref:COP9 signalosome complex subunit 3 n=1 Tax=Amylocarpus encephaloides TaxID=45428 RepID=A0A9P7YRZ3_9HELO|nr:hypothetical protein BJ875DRAFT_502271 [Amylocarpus encephaloides]